MNILSDLLSAVDPKTNVRVRGIYQGPFHTAVLTRNCGLASTLYDHSCGREEPSVKEAGLLMEKEAMELARMAYSMNLLEASIGMATINSLLKIDEERCISLNARVLLAEKGKDKKVALVGHFPFVPELGRAVKELWVIEQHPREGDFTAGEATNLIPQADVVGITGSAFINHTMEHLLALCRPDAYVIILGATTPLSPILLDYGVDAISGTKVIDEEEVLKYVGQGATFRQLKGIQLLTMKR